MNDETRTFGRHAGALLAALALAACSKADGSAVAATVPARAAATSAPFGPAVAPLRPLTAAAEVGKQLFFDKALSASGTMACATCHDPDHAYGPPNHLSVQLGGPQ